jgi:eukaryotic-like serine/threonine-protein kinase
MSATAKDLPPGTVLGGRYEIRGKLGSGAFSSVYRARDRTLDTDVAVKLLHRWASAEPALVERFKREVVLSRRVRHEGCCRVYDFVELDGQAMLTMELIEGWTLEEVLDRLGLLPLQAGLALAAGAAGVVAGLHQSGVVHRDVKETNLMLRRQGRLVVLDFGLAWSSVLSTLTRLGTLVGTPTHVAPERILGGEPTMRSDVYSLGVVSYHLLTGRLPFRGHDLGQVLAMHVHGQPDRPRKLRPEIGRDVEALVLRCLAKDPGERPADAGELERDWQGLLGGPPPFERLRELIARMEGAPAVENSPNFQQDVPSSPMTLRRGRTRWNGRERWVVALLVLSIALAAAVVLLLLLTLKR